MSRSLKYEIPGLDWRKSPMELSELGLDGFFSSEGEPAPRAYVLEIGFGRGEFLLDLAAKAPEIGFLGVEVSFKRALKMARKVARHKLENVRLLEARGEIVVQELLPPGSMRGVWLNFPDPWPKKRHASRRLIQRDFVRSVARCLEPGGVFQVATDDIAYRAQIDAVLRAEPQLCNQNAPKGWLTDVPGRFPTGYELQWRAEGRPLYFFCYASTSAEKRPQPDD